MVVTGDGAGMTTQPSLYQAVRPRRSQRSQRDQAAVKPGSGCGPRSGSKTSLPTRARVRYLLPRGAGGKECSSSWDWSKETLGENSRSLRGMLASMIACSPQAAAYLHAVW